jgi:hypothetical protein
MKTTDQVLTGGVASKPSFGKAFLKWEPFAMLYARFALGAAFLSAVAARLVSGEIIPVPTASNILSNTRQGRGSPRDKIYNSPIFVHFVPLW